MAQVQLRKIDVALFLGSAALAWAGELERAIDGAERALRISPFDRLNYCAFIGPAMSHLLNGRNDEAANAGRRAVHSNPGFSSCHAAALAELGRVDEAESVAAHILVLQPSFSTHGFCAALALPTTLANRLAEAWRAAGGGDRQQIRRRKGRISVFCGVRTAAVPARRIPRGKRLAGTLLTRMSRSN